MSYEPTDREAIDFLRALGVKAAHPRDGWVNPQRGTVHLAYPLFDDGVEVGDTIALGWPRRGYRLMRVLGFEGNRFALTDRDRERWHIRFEETGRYALLPMVEVRGCSRRRFTGIASFLTSGVGWPD